MKHIEKQKGFISFWKSFETKTGYSIDIKNLGSIEGVGTWHANITFFIKKDSYSINCRFSCIPSGCGCMIFSGYYGSTNNINDEIIEIISELFELYSSGQSYNVGSFITTSGHKWINDHNFLKKLGFKKLTEYDNLAHEGNDKQILFQLIIKK